MDTYGWKFSKHEFMTMADNALARRLREAGQLTFFRVLKCEGAACSKEIPKGKRYCSKECWKKSQPKQEETDDATEE